MSISWIVEYITWPLTEFLFALFAFLVIFFAIKNKSFSHLYEPSSKEGRKLCYLLAVIFLLVVINSFLAGH